MINVVCQSKARNNKYHGMKNIFIEIEENEKERETKKNSNENVFIFIVCVLCRIE